jgi:hypothetical protein
LNPRTPKVSALRHDGAEDRRFTKPSPITLFGPLLMIQGREELAKVVTPRSSAPVAGAADTLGRVGFIQQSLLGLLLIGYNHKVRPRIR